MRVCEFILICLFHFKEHSNLSILFHRIESEEASSSIDENGVITRIDQYLNATECEYESSTETDMDNEDYGNFNENVLLENEVIIPQNFEGSNAKAIISSETYITYLRDKQSKKEAIILEKLEKKKQRLHKAEEKLNKMHQNVENLRSQIL